MCIGMRIGKLMDTCVDMCIEMCVDMRACGRGLAVLGGEGQKEPRLGRYLYT